MIEIVAGGAAAEGAADALIVGSLQGRAFDPVGEWAAGALGDWLGGYLDDADFQGKPGQVVSVPGGDLPYRTVVFVGMGESPDAEDVRQAAGLGARAVTRAASVATSLHGAGADGAARAVAEGFLLGQYRFDRHRSEPKPALTETLTLLGAGDGDVEAARLGALVAEGVAMARDLVNESAMYKPPVEMARIATEMAEAAGMRIEVWDEGRIEAEGLGGLRGVSLGAANPPRLVQIWHEPEDARGFLAIVGKGIVFDSGGLSIKPAASMETMKTDMAGAAAVFGAMRVIAGLGLPVKVLGITPLTENMTGGAAQRPGDVLTARNGKTIEVLNTDAEGRLVLADGLSLAVEQGPDMILDLATLTGACMIALGDKIAGLFGTADATEAVQRAAEAAGERVWQMPLPADYRKKIDSDVADMKNTGPRYGGAINAALLLQEFVGDVPWAHLDIAGPARASDAEHYVQKGGTGFGVRTIVALASAIAEGRAGTASGNAAD
ncbi:MAG: leucyl aminopeptidase [Actinobacteria bacterium]|nr:leucyl aminopeptidase [Actinomycetota bacterium]